MDGLDIDNPDDVDVRTDTDLYINLGDRGQIKIERGSMVTLTTDPRLDIIVLDSA